MISLRTTMSKSKHKTRRHTISKAIYGPEPHITSNSSNLEIIQAYNWFDLIYDNDDAKRFVIEHLKSKKIKKEILQKVSQIKSYDLRTVGWNCRILSNGGELPVDIGRRMLEKLDKLIKKVIPEQKVDTQVATVISIQKRVENRVSTLIADLEEQLDIFSTEGETSFDIESWFRTQAIKPQIAGKIGEYYSPLYDELFEVMENHDPDLRYAYRKWKKPALKKYMEFVRNIVSTSKTHSSIVKVQRNPRKKKEKPAAVLVSKLKYKERDDSYNLISIRPHDIIGAEQLWTFNTKIRTLTVYNTLSPIGLSVKGTTITGFDKNTSITKKLRNPEIVLKRLMEGGKIVLRKLLEEVNSKPKKASGRINKDVVIIKASR